MKQTQLILLALLLFGCGTEKTPSPQAGTIPSRGSTSAAPVAAEKSTPLTKTESPHPLPSPTVLLDLDESAYGKTIGVDGQDVYLIGNSAMWRFSPGKSPQKTPLSPGYAPAFSRDAIIHWADGAIHATPKSGGRSRVLGKVARQPLQIVASGELIAWLDRDDVGRFSLQNLKGSKARVAYKASGAVSSPVMNRDGVFFIEQASDGTWRIGFLSMKREGKPVFSSWHTTRIPSTLSASDVVYYYDLPTRSIRRLSVDLSTEEIVAQKVVCSPLAVSDRVLCARVEGIFEVPIAGGPVKILTREPLGLVTTIAGSNEIVAWVNDTGRDHLTLRMLLLK